MNRNFSEIELGNGYGHFCNIDDAENQKNISPLSASDYRKYLEELQNSEGSADNIPDNKNKDENSNSDKKCAIVMCFIITIMALGIIWNT